MQNIWNGVHISDILNCYNANTKEMWDTNKLCGIYKTFEPALT